jgi:hypothetical protein
MQEVCQLFCGVGRCAAPGWRSSFAATSGKGLPLAVLKIKATPGDGEGDWKEKMEK